MRFARIGGYGLTIALITTSCSSGSGGGDANAGDGGSADQGAGTTGGDAAKGPGSSTGGSSSGGTSSGGASSGASSGAASSSGTGPGDAHSGDSMPDSTSGDTGADAPAEVGPPVATASCTSAPAIDMGSQTSVTLQVDTTGAPNTVTAPCASDSGAEVFYEMSFSEPVIFYADTFGSGLDTVLFLLSGTCAPVTTSTMTGDAVCNDDACGVKQSQVVARLAAGRYHLGIAGHGSNVGPATLHAGWARAPKGTLAQLAQGSSVESGATSGTSGNIQGVTSACLAAGPEDGYWWTTCPSDAGGSLSASTCGGATWESLVYLLDPTAPATVCSKDSCGLQSSLTTSVAAGAGLRELVVDGQTATDSGNYTLTVMRP